MGPELIFLSITHYGLTFKAPTTLSLETLLPPDSYPLPLCSESVSGVVYNNMSHSPRQKDAAFQPGTRYISLSLSLSDQTSVQQHTKPNSPTTPISILFPLSPTKIKRSPHLSYIICVRERVW